MKSKKSTAKAPLKTFKGVNVDLTLLPDRLVVQRKKLSHMNTQEQDDVLTVNLDDITCIDCVPRQFAGSGLIKLTVQDSAPLWVIYASRNHREAQEFLTLIEEQAGKEQLISDQADLAGSAG